MKRPPLVWWVTMPLDYAADPPTMERMVVRFQPRALASFDGRYRPDSVRVAWGVQEHSGARDPDTGKVRTEEWDTDTPVPNWAAALVLLFTADPTD